MQRIVGNNPSPGARGRTRDLQRFAFLFRLQAQALPSVANPFSGAIHALRSPCFAVAPAQAVPGLWAFGGVKVHRTFILLRLTHWTFAYIRFTPLEPLQAEFRLRTTFGLRKGAKKQNS